MFCNIFFFFFFFWGLDLFVVVESRGWCRKWKQIWLFLILVSLNCRGNIEHTLLLKIWDLLIFITENARTSATKYLHVLKTLHQCHIFCNSIYIYILGMHFWRPWNFHHHNHEPLLEIFVTCIPWLHSSPHFSPCHLHPKRSQSATCWWEVIKWETWTVPLICLCNTMTAQKKSKLKIHFLLKK